MTLEAQSVRLLPAENFPSLIMFTEAVFSKFFFFSSRAIDVLYDLSICVQ